MLNPASTEQRTSTAGSELQPAVASGSPTGSSIGIPPDADLASSAAAVEPTTAIALVVAAIGLWLYRVARRLG